MSQLKLIAAVVVGALLAGCSANGAASPPASVIGPQLQNSVLQLAVGTANIGQTGTIGTNTVVTFRQPNGDSAALVNSPTLTGPTGWTVPACGTGCVDAGTNHVSSTPQNVDPNVSNPVTVFGQSGGAFSYGFAPDNVGATGAAVYTRYAQPLLGSPLPGQALLTYNGGPPAYPFFKDGTFPAAFPGYPQGFTMFAITPVAGTYNLNVVVQTSNNGTLNFTASSTLSNLTPLPALATPTFVKDNLGGGSGVVTVPVDARVVETMVYVQNASANTFFAIGPIRGTGPQPYTLPDFLGPCGGAAGTGCQNNAATQTRTINTGDTFRVYAVTVDWPMFEGSPPGNTQQAPAINGGAATSNQADITTSPRSSAIY